jgi:hypothetical protein
MRLSDWRAEAPHRDALTSKVVTVIEPVLTALGAEADPICWVVWGDDPAIRYVLLVPTDAGMLLINVRVNVPQEGPRAGGKLIRWNRLQTGELALEMSNGHRLLSFQVEGNILRGSDDEADAIAGFALQLYAAIDGRPYVPPARPARRKRPPLKAAGRTTARSATASIAKSAAGSGAKPAATPSRAVARRAASKGAQG